MKLKSISKVIRDGAPSMVDKTNVSVVIKQEINAIISALYN